MHDDARSGFFHFPDRIRRPATGRAGFPILPVPEATTAVPSIVMCRIVACDSIAVSTVRKGMEIVMLNVFNTRQANPERRYQSPSQSSGLKTPREADTSPERSASRAIAENAETS